MHCASRGVGSKPILPGQLTTLTLLLLLGAAADCGRRGDARPVGEIAGGLPPFGELRGVRLGMTAAELKRARPEARPASYTGYVEETARGRITYAVPGSWTEGSEVPAGNRLESVSAESFYPSDSAAREVWLTALGDAARRLGEPPQRCTHIVAGTEGDEAVWRRGNAALVISIWEVRRQARTPADSAGVRAQVLAYSANLAQIEDAGAPATPGGVRRSPAACPGVSSEDGK